MRTPAVKRLIGGVILLAIVAFVIWYVEADDFSDARIAGTYVRQDQEIVVLTLKPDHHFLQEVNQAGIVKRSGDTWMISGEGHISFSDEFIPISGLELSPAGKAYGQLINRFGIVTIVLAPNPNGPTLYKKWFH